MAPCPCRALLELATRTSRDQHRHAVSNNMIRLHGGQLNSPVASSRKKGSIGVRAEPRVTLM
eukprot:6863140-Pyramimonas_sp.AAC.1